MHFLWYNLSRGVTMTKIERLDHQGRGIAYYNGKVTFIPYTLVGEEVIFEIVKEHKKYIEGKLIEIIKKSDLRVKPDCKYFTMCGGCDLLHMSYQDELKYKQDKVTDIVKRYLGDYKVNSILYGNRYNYRNKVVFKCKDNKIGFYKNKSNEVINVRKCLIASEKINNVIDNLKGNKDIQVRYSNIDNSVMIDDNPKYIISKIGDYKFKISSPAFFQVNYEMVKVLYDKVLEYSNLSGSEKLLDLYCGTGTIGIYLSKYAEEVLGIEINSSAIIDANENVKLNNVTNANFICSDTNKLITKNNFKPDVVVVDPPRSGLTPKVISDIIKLNPKRIVYVSCDVMTFVRDLKEFEKIYNIREITPVNMFPCTYHVENVCLLERK